MKIMTNYKLYVAILVCSTLLTNFLDEVRAETPYKQIKLPLGNQKEGVPYFYDPSTDGDYIGGYKAYYLGGFEVDNDNKMYFFNGGETATLACYDNDRQLYRKEYSNISSSQLYLFNDTLYVFDNNFQRRNNLFAINKTNGNIIHQHFHILDNSVNNYIFRDGFLMTTVFNKEKNISMSTPLYPLLFNLKGQFVRKVDNVHYDQMMYDSRLVKEYKGNFVFWEPNYEKDENVFILKDGRGVEQTRASLPLRITGDTFAEDPIEHKKIRGSKLYVLGRKGEEVVITVVLLKDLFPQLID